MKVLVLWADDRVNPNLGVRALAEGTRQLAHNAWGENTEVSLQDFGPDASGVSFGKSAIVQELLTHGGAIRTRLADENVILDTGAGDSFTDAYGLKRLIQMTTVQRAASELGKTLVMGPQTIGPFRTVAGKRLAARALARMTTVIARDPASAIAAEELGRPVDLIATDVVFALPRPSIAKTRDIILNVSGLIWQPNTHVEAEQYRDSIRDSIETLLASGRGVTIMSHVIGPDRQFGAPETADNDTPAIKILEREFAGRSGFSTAYPADLHDARRILGSANLVIGSRMHACLNALSMGTPAIPLAYSRKFGPLLADLGWEWTIDLRAQGNFRQSLLDRVEAIAASDVADQVTSLRAMAEERLSRAVEVIRGAVQV